MSVVLLSVFPIALFAAALSDLKSMTIPNWMVGFLAVCFLPFALTAGLSPTAVGMHVLTGGAVLTVTFCCFAAGWMGGGDAKLIAAAAVWLGPTPALLSFAIWTSLLGGVLTLAFLLARACLSPTTGLASVDRLLHADTGIPYGVAIGGAGLIMTPSLLAALPV
ncbi:prepilin peptidase [Aureimonas sp. AU22]|uniref:A24 family peptidase n=1 Tax=Aureimonas sp. AU22 TaxID=1638162 RepID=UPI000784E95F|nr:prepilin peptidase [Aureimonas sp. AU22]